MYSFKLFLLCGHRVLIWGSLYYGGRILLVLGHGLETP